MVVAVDEFICPIAAWIKLSPASSNLQNNLTSPTRISAFESTLFDFMLENLSCCLCLASSTRAGSFPTILPNGHCLTSDNPRAALPHEYQSDLAVAPIFSSDISSPSKARRYRPLPNRRNNRKGRDTHNITGFKICENLMRFPLEFPKIWVILFITNAHVISKCSIQEL